MVKEDVGLKEDVYYDGYLKSNLDVLKQAVDKDLDVVIMVDGAEGSGKSTLAQQVGKYLDPSLELERITFSADDFMHQVREAQPKSCVIFDEAYGGLSSRESMTLVNRTIIRLLAEIRQKRLFIIIVCPTFFDLDKYVALWRSRCLLHVYLGRTIFDRGFFRFYSAKKKKDLFIDGKKTYSYKVHGDFYGRFTGKYVVNENKYREKKMDALKKNTKIPKLRDFQYRRKFFELLDFLIEERITTYDDMAGILSQRIGEPITGKGLRELARACRVEFGKEKT